MTDQQTKLKHNMELLQTKLEGIPKEKATELCDLIDSIIFTSEFLDFLQERGN